MKKEILSKFTILTASISLSVLIACEDVITVDLRNIQPKIVIEGSISNLEDSVIILVHKSTDYFKPLGIKGVNDAEVNVTDPSGHIHKLLNISDGKYYAEKFPAEPGDVFSLSVTEAGTSYTADSKMPLLVKIDTVIIDKNPERPGEDRINVHINDPPGVPNYYQLEVFRNDTLLNTGNHFILYSDKYFDGRKTSFEISGRRLEIEKFLPGDRVRVRLRNIERNMYEYFGILHRITDENEILSAATPSNPPNSISNGALGYFGAWSISEKTCILHVAH